MPDETKVRLFVAILLPEELKTIISEAQAVLREQLGDRVVSWSRQEQFHLTLKFLGSVAEANIQELSRVLDASAQQFVPFELWAAGAGCFPNAVRPRVIWAGLEEKAGLLGDLHLVLEEKVLPFTKEKPENRFHAHVTLGRVKQFDRDTGKVIASWSERYKGVVFGHWRAESIALVQSFLSPRGATYHVLHASTLGGAV